MARAILITSAACVVLLLGFAACGGDDERAEPAEETTTDAAATGDPAAGADVFASAGCGNCHTLAAADASGTTAPNLDEVQPDFETVVRQVTNGGGGMPAFEGRLSEQEIRDVAAFVSENAGG